MPGGHADDRICVGAGRACGQACTHVNAEPPQPARACMPSACRSTGDSIFCHSTPCGTEQGGTEATRMRAGRGAALTAAAYSNQAGPRPQAQRRQQRESKRGAARPAAAVPLKRSTASSGAHHRREPGVASVALVINGKVLNDWVGGWVGWVGGGGGGWVGGWGSASVLMLECLWVGSPLRMQ